METGGRCGVLGRETGAQRGGVAQKHANLRNEPDWKSRIFKCNILNCSQLCISFSKFQSGSFGTETTLPFAAGVRRVACCQFAQRGHDGAWPSDSIGTSMKNSLAIGGD